MAKRRPFVPENPTGVPLEARLAPSSLASWFDSEFTHIKEDLGIEKKPPYNPAAGIAQLWKESPTLSKPHPAAAHPHRKVK